MRTTQSTTPLLSCAGLLSVILFCGLMVWLASCRRHPVSDLEVHSWVGTSTLSNNTYIDYYSRQGTWITVAEAYDNGTDTCACWEVTPNDTLHHGYNHTRTTFFWKEVFMESQCSTAINYFNANGHF